MLKRNDIERFYQEVGKLDLKFPVAAIAKATGESKGNVSRILNKKLAPSESFLKRFNEKFSLSTKNVPHGTEIDMTTMTMKPSFGGFIEQLSLKAIKLFLCDRCHKQYEATNQTKQPESEE